MPPTIKTKPITTTDVREKMYPKLDVKLRVGDAGLTAADAEELLGLTWEDDGVKFGPDFLFKGRDGRKARCQYNVTNRPLYWSNVEDLLQRILNRRWAGPNGNGTTAINPEPIIIGEYGSVLNGQHQCVALVIAQQTLDDEIAGEKWRTNWPTGVIKIDKLVVYGAGEDDAVVNTMDTAKPRSDVDVIYRSPYFADLPPADRKYAAQALSAAVRTMWNRTGLVDNAYHPRKTIEEVVAFLDRHPSLIRAIKHVREEDAGGRLGKLGIRPGPAAAFMYLFASSETDGDSYRAMPHPDETSVDFSRWEAAEEFWTLLASDADDFAEVRYALGALVDATTGEGGTRQEREGTLVKAWDVWATDGKFRKDDQRLRFRPDDYTTDAWGNKFLVACPVVDGIDVGEPDDSDKPAVAERDEPENDTPLGPGEDVQPEDPTPAEIEAAKLTILDEKMIAANGKARAPKAPKVKLVPKWVEERNDGTVYDQSDEMVPEEPKTKTRKVKPATVGEALASTAKPVNPVTGRTANNETPTQAKKSPKTKPKKS